MDGLRAFISPIVSMSLLLASSGGKYGIVQDTSSLSGDGSCAINDYAERVKAREASSLKESIRELVELLSQPPSSFIFGY